MGIPARALPVAAFLPLATLVISACGGPGPRVVGAPPMRLAAYSSCQNLLDGLRAATAQQVGPYGLQGNGPMPLGGIGPPVNREMPLQSDGAPTDVPQHSSTNVQEPGVDEPDTVKTDGRRIVALSRNTLEVIDAAAHKITGRLSLPGAGGYPAPYMGSADSLLLSGDHALVIARQSGLLMRRPLPGFSPLPMSSQLKLYDVDLSGAAPTLTATLNFDGSYVAARQLGSVARIVVRSAPHIDFPPPPSGPPSSLTEQNRNVVRQAPLSDWLPRYDVAAGGRTQSHQVPCDQVSHPPQYTGTSLLTVLTLDLSKPLTPASDAEPVTVLADGQMAYASTKSLYVTHVAYTRPPSQQSTTDLYKFDISGSGRPRYLASGSVPGLVLSQYSMSEYSGNIHIAGTEGAFSASTKSETSVHVLAQQGARLDEIGAVSGLGKGERVYAVRFLGPVGYVVTFRQTDPLYTLDLHNPAHPALTGQLHLNGFSAYLHPISNTRLLGVGQDATSGGQALGAQLSLFDVSAATPRRLTAFSLPDSTTQAQYDPHAFLYWPATGLTVLPVMHDRQWSAQVEAFTVTPDTIHRLGTITHPGGPVIDRSLVIGSTLWTFSDVGAEATDATTLSPQSWLAY